MEDSIQEAQPWNFATKIFFKFFFILFSLFILLENNGSFLFLAPSLSFLNENLRDIIFWTGKSILNINYRFSEAENGSGDKTYDYVIIFFITMVAVGGTLIWTALDRNKKNYQELYYCLTILVGFYVGLTLIQYGFAKIYKTQFPLPGMSRLLQEYGNSTPMGLAWTYLGFSKGYNIFMGVAEILGVLLLFKRTMTVGAIISLMTTSNVMAVNYFFDVPVKILSTFLFIMCLFLLAKNFRKLFAFFFAGKSENLNETTPLQINDKLKYGLYGLRILILGTVLIMITIYESEAARQFGDDRPIPPLYGAYYAETFVLKKDTLLPLITDVRRWKYLLIDRKDRARVKYLNDSSRTFTLLVDIFEKKINLSSMGSSNSSSFQYSEPDENHLLLTGVLETDSAFINLKKIDLNDSRLMGTGFNWINEFPNNR